MAQLFDVDVRTVNKHLKNSFKSGELQEDSVIRKFRRTAADGKYYNTNFYHLDAIIPVGYRVNSVRATNVLLNFKFFQYRIAVKIIPKHQ